MASVANSVAEAKTAINLNAGIVHTTGIVVRESETATSEKIEVAAGLGFPVVEGIVQRNNKLVALVYPDMDEVSNMGLTNPDVETIMEQNLKELNNTLPAYCKIAEIKIHDEEFAKTPKKSIKRYMYN